MESPSHSELKRLALHLLVQVGCRAAATEVLCPIARYRLDAAGLLDAPPGIPKAGERAAATLWSLALPTDDGRRRNQVPAQSVIVECKRSRADFFRNGVTVDDLLARRDRLRERRRGIELDIIPRAEPHLRRSGTALFEELEEWDYAASRLAPYRRVLTALKLIDRQLYGHTKFSRIVRYRLADRLFVMAPAGLLRRHELPEGWGLIECPTRDLGRAIRAARAGTPAAFDELVDLPLRISVDAPLHDSPSSRRQRLLRNIAIAATRAAMRVAESTSTSTSALTSAVGGTSTARANDAAAASVAPSSHARPRRRQTAPPSMSTPLLWG